MASRMVSGLSKLGTQVGSNTGDRTRNERAVQGLLERCSDVVPDGTATLTLEEAQFYLGRQIQFEAEALRRQDDSHEEALVQVYFDRITKNESYKELYATMLQTRQGFEIIHGKGSGVRLMGSKNEIPEDPTRLRQTAARLLGWLRDPEWELPETEGAGFHFDREATATAIEDPLNRLESAMAAIPEELRGSVDTLVSKHTALDRFQKLVGRGARFLEALYDVAGMEGESDRIRQSSHRSANRPEPPPPEAAAPADRSEPEAAAEAAAEGAPPEAPAPAEASSPPEASAPSEAPADAASS